MAADEGVGVVMVAVEHEAPERVRLAALDAGHTVFVDRRAEIENALVLGFAALLEQAGAQRAGRGGQRRLLRSLALFAGIEREDEIVFAVRGGCESPIDFRRRVPALDELLARR